MGWTRLWLWKRTESHATAPYLLLYFPNWFFFFKEEKGKIYLCVIFFLLVMVRQNRIGYNWPTLNNYRIDCIMPRFDFQSRAVCDCLFLQKLSCVCFRNYEIGDERDLKKKMKKVVKKQYRSLCSLTHCVKEITVSTDDLPLSLQTGRACPMWNEAVVSLFSFHILSSFIIIYSYTSFVSFNGLENPLNCWRNGCMMSSGRSVTFFFYLSLSHFFNTVFLFWMMLITAKTDRLTKAKSERTKKKRNGHGKTVGYQLLLLS